MLALYLVLKEMISPLEFANNCTSLLSEATNYQAPIEHGYYRNYEKELSDKMASSAMPKH